MCLLSASGCFYCCCAQFLPLRIRESKNDAQIRLVGEIVLTIALSPWARTGSGGAQHQLLHGRRAHVALAAPRHVVAGRERGRPAHPARVGDGRRSGGGGGRGRLTPPRAHTPRNGQVSKIARLLDTARLLAILAFSI